MGRGQFLSLVLLLFLLSFILPCQGKPRGGRGGGGRGGGRGGRGGGGWRWFGGSSRGSSYSSGSSYHTSRSYSVVTTPKPTPETILSPTGAERWTRGDKGLDSILRHTRYVEENTRYGTTFSSSSTLRRQLTEKKIIKRIGLGVLPSFLAGSDYVTQRAFISVYHRYRKYLELQEAWDAKNGVQSEGDSLSAYYNDFYHKNKCASGCPENTTCEWGLCQCEDPEMVQIWGECVLPDDENLLHRNGTLSEEEIVGVSCLNDSDCQAEDVNALCVNSECKCRQEMQWNTVALECQVFIDVDCGDWAGYYSASSLFKDILKAEDVYKRGYKDSSEKHDLIMNITGLDSFTLSLLGTVPGKLCEFYGNSYRSTWELRRACSISKNNPGAYLLRRSLPSKYTRPVPTNRTQDPEEALEGSLLSFFSMNKTDFHPITPPELIPSMVEDDEGETGRGMKHYLREAFCRSVEPFSEVFDTKAKPRFEDGLGTTWMKDPTPTYLKNYDDRINRPSKCWRIPPRSTNCARLYDSSSCSQKAWKILVRDGEQRSFAYFSSDWKYRNDADLVAVRHGCAFTGFTGVNFSGASATISAPDMKDRWVLFANSSFEFEFLHESILSYQCICRNQTIIYEVKD